VKKEIATAAQAFAQMKEVYPEPCFMCGLNCWTPVDDFYVISLGFSELVRGFYAKVLWIRPGDARFSCVDFTSDPALFGELLKRSGRKDLHECFTPEGEYWRPARPTGPAYGGAPDPKE